MRMLAWRMNRATYWLCLVVVVAIFGTMVALVSKPPGILEIVMVFVCMPRLHDIGLSGWYVLIGFGIELAGIAAALIFLPLDQVMVASGVIVLVLAGLMIWLGCIKGQAAANAWGEPPEPGLHFKARG